MVRRSLMAQGLLALVLLLSACARPTPAPAPVQSPAAIAAATQQPTITAKPTVVPEPTVPSQPTPNLPGTQSQLDPIDHALMAAMKTALGRDALNVQVSQTSDDRYSVVAAYSLQGIVSTSATKPQRAAVRNAAEVEAAKVLRALFATRSDIVSVDLHIQGLLQQTDGTLQTDLLRVMMSRDEAQKLAQEGRTGPEYLAGADMWWWQDMFVSVGAASEKLYDQKNAFMRPQG